jgi:DNA-binding transcriptional ArsR family regulator
MDGIILDMNEAPLPLFRSRTQFALLGELFTRPGLEIQVGELADRIDASQPTVSREVAKLAQSGLVRVHRDGNRTLVSANLDSVVAPELRSLLNKLYGPAAAIREALAQISGVEEAFIFGSWAARWHGTVGPPPRDIDVLVIGEVDHDTAWTSAAALSSQLGIEVNPTIRTRLEWEQEDTGFAEDVKSSPQVDVTPMSLVGAD